MTSTSKAKGLAYRCPDIQKAAVGQPLLSKLAIGVLGLLLLLFILLGRGFAGLRIGPAYIGDAILLALVGSALVSTRKLLAMSLQSAITICSLCLLLGWGIYILSEHVTEYGMIAMRDSVVLTYSAFAIVIPLVVRREGIFALFAKHYQLVPLIALWLPVSYLLRQTTPAAQLVVPGFDGPLIYTKMGDTMVHLGICAVASMIAAPTLFGRGGGSVWRLATGIAVAVSVGIALVITNRGGLVAFCGCILAGVLLGRKTKQTSVLIGALLLGTLLAAQLSPIATYANIGGLDSSVLDLDRKIQSILSDDYDYRFSGTKEWRLRWWSDIWAYTVNGPYFWAGKGFGIHLAWADGIHDWNYPVRSPHNSHICILARSGVTGLVLWSVANVSWLIMMISTVRRSRARSDNATEYAAIVVLCYWFGFLINMSFDVVLEAPHSGIVFYSVLGFGLSLAAPLRRRTAA